MKYRNMLFAVCLGFSGMISAQSVYPGQHRGKMKKETVVPLRAESFDLKDVRLLPGRFRENMMRDSAWMASIEVNRLLHSFRTNAAPFSDPEQYNDYYTYDYYVPAGLKTTLQIDKKHPERALKRTGDGLRFTTPQGDVIRPLYDLHRQRYVVYWDFVETETR